METAAEWAILAKRSVLWIWENKRTVKQPRYYKKQFRINLSEFSYFCGEKGEKNWNWNIAKSSFWCPFAWNTFFYPPHFQFVSLDLKWISYRQHSYRFWFCIHSATLSLLVGAFNLFTIKVIVSISIYVLSTIWLIVLDLFCRSFFPLILLFSYDLMTIFNVMFGFLCLFCMYIHYRFLFWDYHEVLG